MRRIFLVSLVLATALLAASAGRAQMMMGPGNGMGATGFFSNGSVRGATMLTAPRDMSALARTWLDSMHDELGIGPQQEGAWLAFSNAVIDAAGDMQAFRAQMTAASTATAPQRAALAERFMDQRHESALAMSEAIAALYQGLSPAQRAILDQRFAAACAPGGLFGN